MKEKDKLNIFMQLWQYPF